MANFLSPFWEFLFEAFGVFGIGIAMGIVTVIIIIALLLISGVVALIKKIIAPHRKIQQRKPTYTASTYTTQTYNATPKSESYEAPKSEAPAKKTENYKSPSFDDYLKRAKEGEAFAQCCCGSMYADKDDIDSAIYWFEKASEQGHVLSSYRLGMIYFEGIGTDVNLELAEKYLTDAAEGDDDSAQYQLAMLYSKKNNLLCEKMGYTTADERTSDAQYNENKEKYKYWLKKAAANGNMDAEYILF